MVVAFSAACILSTRTFENIPCRLSCTAQAGIAMHAGDNAGQVNSGVVSAGILSPASVLPRSRWLPADRQERCACVHERWWLSAPTVAHIPPQWWGSACCSPAVAASASLYFGAVAHHDTC